jgi:hypothetical protein
MRSLPEGQARQRHGNPPAVRRKPALIDNVGGGLSWPTLRTSLKAESAREILLALLVPSAKQVEALKASEGWAPEAKALLAKTLA